MANPENKGKKRKKIRKLFRERKKLAIALILVIFLLFSFTAYRIGLNIYFFITDDLAVNLEPHEKSLSVHYDEKPNVTFAVNIKNSFFCDAYCTYEFQDISEKRILDHGSFASSGMLKGFAKSYEIFSGRIGEGQKIYGFDVQCSNLRTWHCLTNENKRKRSSFITLNYGISDYEQFLKDTLRENITQLVNGLSKIDVSMQQLNSRFFELGFSLNLKSLEKDKEMLNNDFNKVVLEFKNLERVWSEENYMLLFQLFNKSYEKKIPLLNERIASLNGKISAVLARHNLLLSPLNEGGDMLKIYNSSLNFFGRISSHFVEQHSQLLNLANELKLGVQKNSFVNYTSLENDIAYLRSASISFEGSLNKTFVPLFLNGTYLYSVEKSMLCRIKGICLNETDFQNEVKSSLVVDYEKLNNLCSAFGSITNTYEIENNKSRKIDGAYEGIWPILEDAKSKLAISIKKNIFDKIKNVTAEDANNSLSLLINISAANAAEENFAGTINYGNLSESLALSLMPLNLTPPSKNYYAAYCEPKQNFNLSAHYGNETLIAPVEDVAGGNFTSRISINLAPNSPLCCILGECKACCVEEECSSDPLLYPILILHGHSFNKDNSPEFSLDAFNKMQSALQQNGYISAGTITPISDYSEIKKGEWGLSSKPISVKGSYYLVGYYNLGSYSIATQKSENIETYAIRLKELIELLKFRTGRDKVIIISHSMGSLVARSYINIFGDDSVDKLIMVASPNKGISGKVNDYCPILGEKKECRDMAENSIFIKKLNDPSKIPKNAKLYNIVGIGCEMNGKTGDGALTKENAELEYAKNFYINGTCSRAQLLHTKILDIEQYPEFYNVIKSILIGNNTQ